MSSSPLLISIPVTEKSWSNIQRGLQLINSLQQNQGREKSTTTRTNLSISLHHNQQEEFPARISLPRCGSLVVLLRLLTMTLVDSVARKISLRVTRRRRLFPRMWWGSEVSVQVIIICPPCPYTQCDLLSSSQGCLVCVVCVVILCNLS